MNNTSDILNRLSQFKDFKMYCEPGPNPYTGISRYIEAEGIRYDITCFSIDEGILNAYIYIAGYLKAKELLKTAKVTF